MIRPNLLAKLAFFLLLKVALFVKIHLFVCLNQGADNEFHILYEYKIPTYRYDISFLPPDNVIKIVEKYLEDKE